MVEWGQVRGWRGKDEVKNVVKRELNRKQERSRRSKEGKWG